MREIFDSLERCVRRSTFSSDRLGRIRWNVYRQHYRRRGWKDHTWWLLGAPELEVGDKHVAELVSRLEPVLAKFMQSGSGRFGNGLFLLQGGSGKWAYPTVEDFARELIVAAVKLGSARVAELVLGWADGEPLKYRINALLNGAGIDGPLNLEAGISIARLPKSSADLPASLPFLAMGATETDFMGGVVMSIDCELSPSLFLPDEDEIGKFSVRRGKYRLASGQLPNLSPDLFCESVSLACNGCIDWQLQWKELGDLEAFFRGGSGASSKFRAPGRTTKISQESLNEAVKIQQARYGRGQARENLELALRRWVRSKRAGSKVDKFIELRIALEALYEIGGLNEKGFRIAMYGAWHLGKDFEQRRYIRETLRKAYDDSSRAVHGGKLKHAKKDRELVDAAQDICRSAILRRLEEVEKPKWDEVVLGAE